MRSPRLGGYQWSGRAVTIAPVLLSTIVKFTALKSSDLVTGVSVALAGAGVFVAARGAGRQLSAQARTARGQFLLDLDSAFGAHEAIHVKLRGKPANHRWWAGTSPSEEEWAAVEAYMGLFERVWALVQDGSIEIEVVERLYGYRLANIVRNDTIRGKLERLRTARDWIDLIELWRALDSARERRRGGVLCAEHPAPAAPYPNVRTTSN
jgi:hypothetical protein